MTKKYYAVKVGKQPGIYNSWNECEKQVNGFSGAEYKKFEKLDDAKNFIGETVGEDDISINTEEAVIAYVDGSYDDKKKVYGSGVYIIHNGIEKEFYKYGNNINFINSRNIPGEIIATLLALEYAKNKKAKKIKIYYDYEGLENWATEKWKTNNVITKIYKMCFEEYKKDLIINFYKIKAHTNNPGNTKADELARKAIEELKNKIEFDISLDEYISKAKNHTENIAFKVENFEINGFNLLKSLLKEKFKIENITTQSSIDSFKVKSNIFNDHLTIILYKTNILLVQGKAHDVFIIIQDFFSKYENYIEIIKLNENYIGTNIKETESEFDLIIKNLSNFLEEEIKNLIFTAYLITKQEKMPGLKDYSFYLMPIMRAIEAFLHAILNDFNIDNPDKFDMFDTQKQNRNYYYLKNDYKKNINNSEIEKSLEECYNFYHQRHDYAHAKNEFANTKTINTPNKVNEFIIDGINKIKNTYDIIYMDNKKS